MARLAAGLRGYLKDRIAWSPRNQTCPIPISEIIYAKRNFVGVSRIYLLTMNEQKQLEVILRVFRGEKRSCEVGVSLEVSAV
jgi:hypothetical protein